MNDDRTEEKKMNIPAVGGVVVFCSLYWKRTKKKIKQIKKGDVRKKAICMTHAQFTQDMYLCSDIATCMGALGNRS